MQFYAIQVKTNKESQFIKNFENFNDLAGVKLIFLQRRLNIRRKGINTTELQPLFSGYVFLQLAGDMEGELFSRIKKTKYFTRFLPSNELVHPLNQQDTDIVKHFIQYGSIAECSQAYFDANDRIIVTKGPLMGLEGSIKSVDRRKKRVRLALEFENSAVSFDLSYDLIEKKSS